MIPGLAVIQLDDNDGGATKRTGSFIKPPHQGGRGKAARNETVK
jgi:hypothetical protein